MKERCSHGALRALFVADFDALVEGERKVVGVMQKEAKKFATTGGWGFEGFGGGNKAKHLVGDNAATACLACHAPQKDHDYVFSRLRE